MARVIAKDHVLALIGRVLIPIRTVHLGEDVADKVETGALLVVGPDKVPRCDLVIGALKSSRGQHIEAQRVVLRQREDARADLSLARHRKSQ